MRSRAERQRAKKRGAANEIKEYNYEKKLKKKLNQGKITKAEYQEKLDTIDAPLTT